MEMKLLQSRDYKKPLYALGLAAAIAVTVTACGNEPVQLAGDTAGPEPTESTTMLGGETTIDTDYTEPTDLTKYDGDDVALAGDVDFCDPDVMTEGQTEDTTEATS